MEFYIHAFVCLCVLWQRNNVVCYRDLVSYIKLELHYKNSRTVYLLNIFYSFFVTWFIVSTGLGWEGRRITSVAAHFKVTGDCILL